MIKLEELKTYKNVSDEFVELVKEKINSVEWEDEENHFDRDLYEFTINEDKLEVVELGDDSWEDEGKFQNNYYTYQFKVNGEKVNLFVGMSVMRSGSYYSDYYYTHYKPEVFRYEVKVVPEVVIPEHEELKYVGL